MGMAEQGMGRAHSARQADEALSAWIRKMLNTAAKTAPSTQRSNTTPLAVARPQPQAGTAPRTPSRGPGLAPGAHVPRASSGR